MTVISIIEDIDVRFG